MILSKKSAKSKAKPTDTLKMIGQVLTDLRAQLDRDDDVRLRRAVGHLAAAGDILRRFDREGRAGR